MSSLKVIVIGLGVQGKKRAAIASDRLVATVDPINRDANYSYIFDVPIDAYDAALVCTGDQPKIKIIEYLIKNGKHILVEKPLLTTNVKLLNDLKHQAQKSGVVCYTAYNHRFEPHFINMANAIKENRIGKIYSVRLFYGNGTARLVRESNWRDKGAGVLTDLGSHLLDTLDFWFNDIGNIDFNVVGAFKHENHSFDHVILHNKSGKISIQLEMSMLSWRNTFECNIYGELGSLHINSLCKWGPSDFIERNRILPSGRPKEKIITELKPDPTWLLEFNHFCELCNRGDNSTLNKDIWINDVLSKIIKNSGICTQS